MKQNKNHMNSKKRMRKVMAVMALLAVLMAGCGRNEHDTGNAEEIPITVQNSETAVNENGNYHEESVFDIEDGELETTEQADMGTQLEVRFGDAGDPFMMQLEDNETARAIARYVGTSDWRLPIYERDEDADYSVLQYYDIPSRYEIPSEPVAVTEEKAGEVYYSEPNRIVLFYHDVEIAAEYTKIGTFQATEEFVTAVEENPVLEGWGNKIIQISQP